MTHCWADNSTFSQDCTPLAGSDPYPSSLRRRNVFQLLALREICPGSKNSKKFQHQTSKARTDGYVPRCEIIDARQSLISWVEADSLRNLSAQYCQLWPAPISTIAAAFNSEGKKLATTHGDHTIKIIDCQTGCCLKVLIGHRRTPWVVRFHPLHSDILASGSLDHQVRLWDANTAACIHSHYFNRPIVSIAFHAQGEVLAVASGHKLFMWHYSDRCGESSPPFLVLKTKRSLRAVHFHPYAAHLLLTAEANDLDSPDFPLTPAMTGFPQYPPANFVANVKHGTHIDDEDRLHFMSYPLPWPSFAGPPQLLSMATNVVNWQQSAEFSEYSICICRELSQLMTSTDVRKADAQLPCIVKLRIWPHDILVPFAPLDPEQCLLTIPHAVLSSEMGAHFSPCGRFLAACVACILPQLKGDHGLQSHVSADALEADTSPTWHPLSQRQVVYELRVYSIEEATFGMVLASRAIRAVHYVTSVQFSPTSEHLLIAYGFHHGSLHWRRAIDQDCAIHTYTIMEVYRVSDMELVRVFASAADEVNVASFHPLAGGGLVYGTKEGKLRIFQYDGPRGTNCTSPNSLF